MLSGIVLAAGESSRMGRLKPLLPYRGTTMVQHIVRTARAAGVDEIVVVTGHAHEQLEAVLAGEQVRIARNSAYREGMLSSVRCGLRAAEAEGGVVVLLGDQPAISVELLHRLRNAFDDGAGIAVPVYQGRRGHPLLVAARFREEILARYDDTGLRGILAAHPDEVVFVEWEDSAVLQDLDTPDDYRRAMEEEAGGTGEGRGIS